MSFLALLGRVVFAGLVLGAFWLAGSWLAGVVNGGLSRTRTEPLVRVGLSRAFPLIVLGLGGVAALSALGVDTRGLLILLATLGLSLALALRDPLADLVSGALLLSERSFSLGDQLTVAGVSGRVREIGLLGTVLESADGAQILVRSALLRAGPLEIRPPAELPANDDSTLVPEIEAPEIEAPGAEAPATGSYKQP